MTAGDDAFEDGLEDGLVAARWDIATETVAGGMMLAAAELRGATPFGAWQRLATEFRQAMYDAPGPAAAMLVADKYADALAAALVELAQHRPQQ